jgi:hypothetical protein
MKRHIESIEEKCRRYFCQNLDVIETMPEEEQKRNRWLFIHTRDIGGAPILDTNPIVYCQLTGEICVAEEPSFFEILFGKTDSHLGIELSKKRLYRCPSCNYKVK